MSSYSSEETFVDKVEKCLKDNGCKTWREVIPDACENWSMPYRVDLIFYRSDFGYIGVEAKNTNSLRSGGRIAKAMKQVNEKYRNQSYFKGNIIEKWCLLVPNNVCCVNSDYGDLVQSEVLQFLRPFLQEFGFNLMEYEKESKWKKARVLIGRLTKKKIQIGGESTWNK